MPPRLAVPLRVVAERLARADVPWVLTGSTARWLLGAAREPRDLDLEVAADHGAAAAAALGIALALQSGAGITSMRGVTEIDGVEVDLSAGIGIAGLRTPEPELWIHVVSDGLELACLPPEESLVRAIAAGNWERLGRVAQAGGAPPRLDYLARRLAVAMAAR